MKTILNGLMIIIFLAVLLSCSKDKPGMLEGLKERTLDYSYIDTTYRSFIRLGTTPESVIGEIGEVLFDAGYVFVFDKLTRVVLVFDSAGRYISKVDSKGRGPGEYTEAIRTFDLDRQRKEIILYDPGLRKLLRYSYDGSFESEVPLNQYFGVTFAYLGGDKYAFWMHNYDDHQIIVTDGKGEVLARHHPRKEFFSELNVGIDRFFSKNCSNSPYYIPIWEDKIYQISQKEVKEIFDFNFSHEMISNKQDVGTKLQKLPYEKYNYFRELIVSEKGGFFTRTSYGNTEAPISLNLISVLTVVGDTCNGVLSSGRFLMSASVDIRKYGFAFSYPIGVRGSDFFTPISTVVANSIYGPIFPDAKNDDNPVLLFFRIGQK